MFKRLADTGAPVALTVDGKAIRARDRATRSPRPLLAAGIDHCRTTPVIGRAARALLPDGRVLRLPGHDRRRRQPPGLPGAGARRHGGRDPARQARGRTMTEAADLAPVLRPRRDRRRAGRAGRGIAGGAGRRVDRAVRRESRRRRTDLSRHHLDAGHRSRHSGRGLLGGRRTGGRGQGERRADRQRRHGLEPRSAADQVGVSIAARRA